MKLEGYTPELFLENFIKDCEVFGEDTTQAIYEEIFSAVCGKKVKLGSFVNELNKFNEEVISENNFAPANIQSAAASAERARQIALATEKAEGLGLTSIRNMLAAGKGNMPAGDAEHLEKLKDMIYGASDKAANAAFESEMANQVAAATSNAVSADNVARTGLLAKIGHFLTTLPGKVKAFFGGLQGKSFGEIMKQGMDWLQANPATALKTTGGIALLAMLIRTLKKRGELNKYKKLQAIYDSGRDLKEGFEEDSKEEIAMNKIIEECQTNKALNNLIFGEEKMESEKSYFAY